MATKRISPAVLQADREAFTALQSFNAYTPPNQAFTTSALAGKLEAVNTSQQAEINAANTLAAARDAAAAAEWEFHNAVLGAKDQVIAQYGVNSDEVQALGLKKKSERKAPKPRAKAAA